MPELVFNELSLHSDVNNTEHAYSLLKSFFELCDSVNNLKIGTLKIKIGKDFRTLLFTGVHYDIHNFLPRFDEDERNRYSTYLAQTTFISDNPYYSYNGVETIGFGFAYENNLITVSINDAGKWSENSYTITKDYLGEEQGADVITEKKEVKHLPHENQLDEHIAFLTESTLNKAKVDISAILTIEDFWNQRSELFEMLDFSMESENLLKKFTTVNHPQFLKAVKYFGMLNLHLIEVGLGKKKFGNLPGDISLDGEATLKKYGTERIFTLSSGNTKTFSAHVKLGGSLRIYLYPEENRGRITIGHIGHHLNTVNFKK